MSRDTSMLSAHPARHGRRLSTRRAWFILFGGPLAWFAQLCLGSMLASWPCFAGMERLVAPLPGYHWTRGAAVALMLLATITSALAGALAWRTFDAVCDESVGDTDMFAAIGRGRTRFVALWGVILGVSFAIVSPLTLLAFVLVPRCAG